MKKIFRDNLWVLLLNLVIAFSILLAAHWDCGIADLQYGAAAISLAIYFCFFSPLTDCRVGNLHIVSTLSVALISALSAFAPGVGIWIIVALLVMAYNLWVIPSTWMLTLLDMFFTAVVAAISYGVLKLIFWLITLF